MNARVGPGGLTVPPLESRPDRVATTSGQRRDTLGGNGIKPLHGEIP